MKKSFTLIELMVVIGIVVLLTVGSITGIVYSSKEKNIKGTADKLRSVISAAVSSAQNPDEGDYGTYKIQVRVYFSGSNNPQSDQNKIRVYKCRDATCTNSSLVPNLSFNAPSGIYLNTGHPPLEGGMSRNNSPNNDYLYFSIMATNAGGNYIGKIVDTTGNATETFLTVSDVENLDISNPPKVMRVYYVKSAVNSGLVKEESIYIYPPTP